MGRALLSFVPLTEPRLPRDGSTMTAGFLRNVNIARGLGWGLSAPIIVLLLSLANAGTPWFVAAIMMAVLYPFLMGWLTLRVAHPFHFVLVGLALDTVALALFAEVLCFEPIFMLVSLCAVAINAVSTRGASGAVVVLSLYALTLYLVHGEFRVVSSFEVPFYIHALLGGFFVSYLSIITQRVYSLTLRNAQHRRELVQQKKRNDAMHQHLVDTIANPFVADETVLKLIGPELNPEQSQQYVNRIRTRQQWEAIGRQTRSVVHDANNLLVPIVGLGAVLENMVVGDNQAEECLTDLNTAVTRLHSLLGQLNPPKTAEPGTMGRCVIQHVASEVGTLLTPALPEGITLHFDYPVTDDLFYVPIEAASLHRCIMNLGTNAIQAMEAPGTLTFGLRQANSYERARLGVGPGQRCVTLFIRDTGKGIPIDVLPRIFEPYFSTKEETGGTGLGLATCHTSD